VNRHGTPYKHVIVAAFIAKIVQAFELVSPKLRAHRR
jgi:hypothetical protein